MALNGNDSSKDHPRGQSWQERWFSHFVSLAIVGMGVFLVNKVMSTEAAVNELKTAVTVIESRLLDIRENSRDRFTGAQWRDGEERLLNKMDEGFIRLQERLNDHEGRLRALERTTGQTEQR